MPPASHSEQFRHEAFFYSSRNEFLDGMTSFIRAGVDAGEPTLVVLDADKIDALRSELNERADGVRFADMREVGANPARIIPAWQEFVDEHGGSGRRLRGIGEPICTGRSSAEIVECQRHESLLNLAFADTPGFYLMCPYDTSLDESLLIEAQRSHPHLAHPGDSWASDFYRGHEELSPTFSAPLPDPRSEPRFQIFQAGTLGALRDFVARVAAGFGFEARLAEDVVIAANEVATNSVLHGGGGGILRMWLEDDALICEINDGGVIDAPLAGRELPKADRLGGHGLWMANQLCDLVQIRSFASGSAVRLHKRRA